MKRVYLILVCLAVLFNTALASTTGVNIGMGPMMDPQFWAWRSPTDKGPGLRWMDQVENLISLGVDLGTGHIFYVDSGVANEGDGSSWTNAVALLADADALCTANRGDVILVAQGHAETISTAALSPTISAAGTRVFCLGEGTLAPTFTITHVDGTVSITGANCLLSGARIVTNVDNVKVACTLGAAADGSTVENCVFRDSAANKDYLVGISVLAGCEKAKLYYNDFRTTAAAGGNNAILVADVNDLEVVGNMAFGKFATGVMLNGTGPLTKAFIVGNTFVNSEAAIAIALNSTTSTGILAKNFLGGTTSIAAALTGNDAMWHYLNYVTGAANASGLLDPAADGD